MARPIAPQLTFGHTGPSGHLSASSAVRAVCWSMKMGFVDRKALGTSEPFQGCFLKYTRIPFKSRPFQARSRGYPSALPPLRGKAALCPSQALKVSHVPTYRAGFSSIHGPLRLDMEYWPIKGLATKRAQVRRRGGPLHLSTTSVACASSECYGARHHQTLCIRSGVLNAKRKDELELHNCMQQSGRPLSPSTSQETQDSPNRIRRRSPSLPHRR